MSAFFYRQFFPTSPTEEPDLNLKPLMENGEDRSTGSKSR
jgi:hypothetical protein